MTDTKNKLSMADLLAKYSQDSKLAFKKGDKVKGTIVEITPKYMLLDIGAKSEGLVAESVFKEAKNYIAALKVGDSVEGVVIIPENRRGYTVISLRNSVRTYNWKKITDAYESKRIVKAKVVNKSGSGLIVDVFGVTGLAPLSQLTDATLDNDDEIVGQGLEVKIIELDKDNMRLILSEIAAIEPERYENQLKALDKVKEGQTYEGVVTDVTDFGIFVAVPVKVGGAEVNLEGLVHLSELSWGKSGKPSDNYKEGDTVSVMVLGSKDGKLSLSVKQTLKDPWDEAAKKYEINKSYSGKVVKQGEFGAIVELEKGIEGLLHFTKIPPTKNLKIGDKIDVVVEEIDATNRKLSLGLVLTEIPVNYK